MVRTAISIAMAFAFLPVEASATILMFLQDEFDDHKAVLAVREVKAVKAAHQQLEAFRNQLYKLKERHIVALFGKPTVEPAHAFAMPVAQSRGLALSGLRYADEKMNKDHTDFYVIGGFAGIKIFYAIDGESPAAILVYFLANEDFPRLTKDNLQKRLHWEQERWQKLVDYFDRRRARVLDKVVVPARKIEAKNLSSARMEQLWQDLAGFNERRALSAIDELAGAYGMSVPFLARQVKPEPVVDTKPLPSLIRDLESPHFAVRAGATRTLEKMHWSVRSAILDAVKGKNALETQMRIGKLLEKMDLRKNADLLRQRRAVRVLAIIDTLEAQQLLERWSKLERAPGLNRAARETLVWLAGESSR